MGGFTGTDGDEFVLAGGDTGATAIDFEPAGFHQDAAFGLETILLDPGQAGRLLELGGRIEDGDEALHDHVVELLLGLAKLGKLASRDDRKVI